MNKIILIIINFKHNFWYQDVEVWIGMAQDYMEKSCPEK